MPIIDGKRVQTTVYPERKISEEAFKRWIYLRKYLKSTRNIVEHSTEKKTRFIVN